MSWDDRPIEKRLSAALIKRFGSDGSNYYSLYMRARQKLIEDVIPNVPAAEPSLTDHGPRHVADVLDNIDKLVYGDEAASRVKNKRLNPSELYALCLSALFHDVGNVYERKEHEKKVGVVYQWVRKGETSTAQEKLIVVRVAGAHGGKSLSGSRDTIEQLFDTHLWREPVRMRELAAILRFADELAEGQQRTSQFMQEQGLYAADSDLFHRYANITTIHIDRGNGRVAVTYNIEVDTEDQALGELKELLQFVYHRIIKLNQERQYGRHYSAILDPFKWTQVRFSFWYRGYDLDMDLPPLQLSDKVVPGEASRTIEMLNPAYKLDALCGRVHDAVARSGAVS